MRLNHLIPLFVLKKKPYYMMYIIFHTRLFYNISHHFNLNPHALKRLEK